MDVNRWQLGLINDLLIHSHQSRSISFAHGSYMVNDLVVAVTSRPAGVGKQD
jgi:hypothetical protein